MPANKTTAESTGAAWGRTILPMLAVAVIAGVWLWGKRSTEPAAAGSPVKSTLHLETFVLNLADPGQRSYLRVGIDLGLGRELGKGKDEDAPPVAELRDTILSVLGQCKADDLLTEAGKDKLKGNLLRALQARVPGQKIEEVYFTEFLIQR